MSDVLNYDANCLFCKIIKGEIPSNKVYEDNLCYAFYDIDPQAPTHFLVIPKAHIASVAEINKLNSAIVGHIFEVISKITKELGIESYRVIPTAESRPVRLCSICISTFSPDVI